MKVRYQDSDEAKALKKIRSIPSTIILRKDLEGMMSDRQITRVFEDLADKDEIVKLGYGVYAKLNYSKLLNRKYLPGSFLDATREALTRLGVKWDISEDEKRYNSGETQQIPANPKTKIFGRFSRKLEYNGMAASFE